MCLVVEQFDILKRIYHLKQLSFHKLMSNGILEPVKPDKCGQYGEQKCKIVQNGAFERFLIYVLLF